MYWIIGKILAYIVVFIIVYIIGYIVVKEKFPFGFFPEEDEIDIIEIFTEDVEMPLPVAVFMILLILIVGLPIISGITILLWPIIGIWLLLTILIFKFKKKKE